MLEITVPQKEDVWIESKQEFMTVPETKYKFEHSLISISKWEQAYKKPFLSTDLTTEEFIGYIKCMSLLPIDDKKIAYLFMDRGVVDKIKNYIIDPMTATTFNRDNIDRMKQHNGRNDIITNEIIYYWMSELNLPFDVCEKWHLNRLLALIEVCNLKKTPSKQMSKNDIYKQNASLNKARKAGRKK